MAAARPIGACRPAGCDSPPVILPVVDTLHPQTVTLDDATRARRRARGYLE
jgi:hypothetical protein